ncbi:alpha/beta fold hydrolase [Sediminitomix flava]|uniref:Pimeloyl-ACP methyl ester carboxylesterase n=1 Tax=Sediminitomix flava TaxID=379075 RepID=A0A315Z986_SEDFL|nr:alpha/beta hydrolase [Sediminitomix flava]PWJ41759.1 pimeloyl-ACP methyl ester carboxylesterase [Sediminitomix flava]
MMKYQKKSEIINGINLKYVYEGEGPAVLLLHGFPDSADLWENQIGPLVEAGFSVIAPDQRGFGDSELLEGVEHYTIDKIAADALALMDHLGVQKARLVGHDFGAFVGWYLATVHADRFECYMPLSVGHPNSYAKAGIRQKQLGWYALFYQFEGIAETMLAKDDWALFRAFVENHPEVETWITALSRPRRMTAGLNWYRANFMAAFSGELPLPNATIPVQAVWSTGDMALAEEQMAGTAEFVDGDFKYHTFEGVSHWITMDASDKLNPIILDFIKEYKG